jgi:hypothetical protein
MYLPVYAQENKGHSTNLEPIMCSWRISGLCLGSCRDALNQGDIDEGKKKILFNRSMASG